MIDVQTISVVMAAAGVVIAVTYYIIYLRTITRTRQAQLFMQLYNRLNDKDFCESYGMVLWRFEWEDFDDWQRKYHPKADLETWTSWVSVARFFSGIGTLVKRKLIDIGLVDNIMGGPVIWTWEKMEPIVKEIKVNLKRPQLWDDFEHLYNEIKKREQQLAVTIN